MRTTKRHGARINNIAYIMGQNKENPFRKCVVCEKALRDFNKRGICYHCFLDERYLNKYNPHPELFRKKRKKIRRKIKA